MRKNKFLALFLTVCMMLTSIGALGITASAEDVTIDETIIVAKGIALPLPETVISATDSSAAVAVTWKNQAGATVTEADTTNVGYHIYTGTTADETPRTLTYRVNVGEEFELLVEDNFDQYNDLAENYESFEAFGKAELHQTIENGKFDKSAYNDSGTGTSFSQRFEKDGTNTVLAFGSHTSDWTAAKWTPTANNDYQSEGDYFRISVDMKVTKLPWDSYNSRGAIMQMNIHNCEGWTFRVEKNDDGTMKNTQFRINKPGLNNVIPTDILSWTEPDADGNIAMEKYVTLTIEGNDRVVAARAGNTLLGTSSWYGMGGVSYTNLVHHIQLANRADVGQTVYLDNMKYSKLIYVTDTLDGKSVSEALEQGDSTEQTATVALNMSDGSTKDFTVKYTADTKTAGEKTAYGTIDGFDGTVPVTYTVAGVTNQTINTYIGAKVTLADNNYADTSTFGRKYYRVAQDDSIINYTVNVGDWGIKVSDDLSSHKTATYTKADGVTTFETIEPVTKDGFKLVITALIPIMRQQCWRRTRRTAAIRL